MRTDKNQSLPSIHRSFTPNSDDLLGTFDGGNFLARRALLDRRVRRKEMQNCGTVPRNLYAHQYVQARRSMCAYKRPPAPIAAPRHAVPHCTALQQRITAHHIVPHSTAPHGSRHGTVPHHTVPCRAALRCTVSHGPQFTCRTAWQGKVLHRTADHGTPHRTAPIMPRHRKVPHRTGHGTTRSIRVLSHAFARPRTHARMHARTHARTHAHMHACTHAHTQSRSPGSIAPKYPSNGTFEPRAFAKVPRDHVLPREDERFKWTRAHAHAHAHACIH